jgi:hypothetical protein
MIGVCRFSIRPNGATFWRFLMIATGASTIVTSQVPVEHWHDVIGVRIPVKRVRTSECRIER